MKNILRPIVLAIFVASFHQSFGETGCPEPGIIQPCVCFNSPYPVLECRNVNDVELLRTVFQNSARYEYREVNLEVCSLQFLPKDMFEDVAIGKLYLKNVTLIQLFDEAPDMLHMLDHLFIENTSILRGMRWDHLQPLTQLRLLTIYFNAIRTLNLEFSEYVTKELQQVTFYATKTRKIKPEVFKNFTKLDKIAIDSCQLTELKRDMFPVPFDVRFLYFNDNRLTSIPEDLFTQMPQLHTVSLRNNQITTIPEPAFGGRTKQIVYVRFDGNPIRCDCLLQWLIKPENKPEVLGGTCDRPERLLGRELSSLDQSEFNC